MDAIVSASSLLKVFASTGVTAVDGIDFHVAEGSCFGFLGPNGAGKTTTMHMVSCKAKRTGGALWVLGMDPLIDERAIKRALGVVPQETNLDVALSVEENLLCHARYFDVPRDEARRRADELLEFVQLSERAGWNVDNLSGGMKRRLLIARALVNRPPLMILDEPTAGLDPQARHLVWEKLRALKREGVTLIITTHYMEEAAHLCDRLVIMHQGKILVEGSPAELVEGQVAREVVELTSRSREELERLANQLDGYAVGHEIAGDRLILHARDGQALLGAINAAVAEYESATLRPATLEDVFLKLTGRTLEE